MKRQRDNAIFSMSFLDVICCAFGAMVLLVLLSKNDDGNRAPEVPAGEILAAAAQKNIELTQRRAALDNQARDLQRRLDAWPAPANASQLALQLSQRQQKNDALARRIQALQLAQNKAADGGEIAMVGGIAVDAERIIFVVDTSGSMQAVWPRVLHEMKNALAIHPQVQGFQVINDMGDYLLKSYRRQWIPDTPSGRKLALSALKNWRSFSNSSPLEGMRAALQNYAGRADKIAIYVLGDDYSSGAYDAAAGMISRLNRDAKTGAPMVRIHAIGFAQPKHSGERFATLMREITRRNRGALVALGRY